MANVFDGPEYTFHACWALNVQYMQKLALINCNIYTVIKFVFMLSERFADAYKTP